MKKNLSLILVLFMCFALLAGCGPSSPSSNDGSASSSIPNASDPAAAAQPAVSINVGLVAPAGDFSDLVTDYWIEQLEGAGVNITVTKYNNAQLGSEASMVDQLFTDSLDVYMGNCSVLANALPAMYAYCLPFLTRDVQTMYEIVTDQELFAETLKICEEAGVHYLANGHVNPRAVSNHIRPVRTADDLKGLTIRTVASAINVATLTALGANPVSTALGETYTALQQGVVDGNDQDMSMGSSMRFYEIDGYFTELNYQWAFLSFLMSDACWQKLTDIQQEAVMDTAWKAQEYGYKIYEERQELSREAAFEMNPDLQIIYIEDLTDDEYRTFVDKVVDIYKEYRGIVGEEYFDKVIAHTDWANTSW